MLGKESALASHGLPAAQQCPWHTSLTAWTLSTTLPEVFVVPSMQSDRRCVLAPGLPSRLVPSM